MRVAIGIALVIIALFALLIWAAIEETKQWNVFIKENECVVIGYISGSSTTATGVGPNGAVTVTPVYIPGKTGWRCKNGIEYWR